MTNNSRLIIPRRTVEWRREKRVERTVALFALIGLLGLLLVTRPLFLADFHRTNLAFFGLFGLIGILLVTKPWRLLSRDVEGRVEQVRILTTTETTSPTKPTAHSLYTVNVPILIVRTPQGQRRKLRMPPRKLSEGTARLDNIEIGDYVARLAGYRYVLHFKPSGRGGCCLQCGLANQTDSAVCPVCGEEMLRLRLP